MARNHDYMPHGTTWGIYLVLSIERHLLLGRKEHYDKTRQCIKNQRHHFADKRLYSQSYGFSRSHVQMYESWIIKKAEYQRINALNCGVGEDS